VLTLFYPTPITVKQINSALTGYGMIALADTSKHLHYLEGKGYIKSEDGLLTNVSEDNVISITSRGIDLAEGTIADDGLYL
jgi:hypothetical protein